MQDTFYSFTHPPPPKKNTFLTHMALLTQEKSVQGSKESVVGADPALSHAFPRPLRDLKEPSQAGGRTEAAAPELRRRWSTNRLQGASRETSRLSAGTLNAMSPDEAERDPLSTSRCDTGFSGATQRSHCFSVSPSGFLRYGAARARYVTKPREPQGIVGGAYQGNSSAAWSR